MGDSANEFEDSRTDAEKALAEGDEKQREARATLAAINEKMAERKKQPLQQQPYNPGARIFSDDRFSTDDDDETLELPHKVPETESTEPVKTDTWSHSTLAKDVYAPGDSDSDLAEPSEQAIQADQAANMTAAKADDYSPSLKNLSARPTSASDIAAKAAEKKDSVTPQTSNVPEPKPGPRTPEQLRAEREAQQAAAKPKQPASKNFYVTVIGASILSGVVGLFFGMKIPRERTTPAAVEPPSDAGFGESKTPLKNPTSRDFVGDIVEQVMPSVVSIDVAAPTSLGPGRGTIPGTIQQKNGEAHKRVLGTGVIIRSDGFIVTSAHVIRGRTQPVYATLSNGESKVVRIVGKDPFTDIALLKMEGGKYPVVHFADSRSFRTGDWAIAIGSPFGFDHSVSLGVISAIGRSISDLNNHVDLIQTDAAMNPGNSGGPLLNSKGEVIGINAVIKNGAQNIGFAVPVDVVKKIANEIIYHGDVKRPYIGLVMDDINGYMAQNTGISEGILVLRVVPGSPCAVAGIVQGDIITKLDGKIIRNTREAREELKDRKPGEVMEFVFFRKNSDEQTRKVFVGEYPYD